MMTSVMHAAVYDWRKTRSQLRALAIVSTTDTSHRLKRNSSVVIWKCVGKQTC